MRTNPNTGINGSYTYSWPFDATDNYFWGDEFAEVYMQCTIAGIFLNNNPIGGGGSPFQSETATTFTTTPHQLQLTCEIQGGCAEQYVRSAGNLPTYRSTLYPDYVPTIITFTAGYGVTVLQFLQEAPCWRTGAGDAWTCQQVGGVQQSALQRRSTTSGRWSIMY